MAETTQVRILVTAETVWSLSWQVSLAFNNLSMVYYRDVIDIPFLSILIFTIFGLDIPIFLGITIQ